MIHKNVLVKDVTDLFNKISAIKSRLHGSFCDYDDFNLFILYSAANDRRLYELIKTFTCIDTENIDFSKPFKIMGIEVQFIYDVLSDDDFKL